MIWDRAVVLRGSALRQDYQKSRAIKAQTGVYAFCLHMLCTSAIYRGVQQHISYTDRGAAASADVVVHRRA